MSHNYDTSDSDNKNLLNRRKNADAQKLYRERKKQHEQGLQQEVVRLGVENQQLKMTVQRLMANQVVTPDFLPEISSPMQPSPEPNFYGHSMSHTQGQFSISQPTPSISIQQESFCTFVPEQTNQCSDPVYWATVNPQAGWDNTQIGNVPSADPFARSFFSHDPLATSPFIPMSSQISPVSNSNSLRSY